MKNQKKQNIVRKVISSFFAVLLLTTILCGNFTFTAGAAAAGTMMSNAVEVTMGENYSKTWTPSTDHLNHYSKFVISKQGIVTIQATKPFDSEGEYSRLAFTVYDVNGDPIWDYHCYESVDDAKSFYKIYVGLAAGTYYLTIKPLFSVYSGTIETTYSINFEANNYCEIEPNAAGYQATSVQMGKKYLGYYGAGGGDYGDDDYFKFSVTAGHTYHIVWYDWAQMSNSSTMIYLLDPSGKDHYIKSSLLENITNDGLSYDDVEIEKSGTAYIRICNEHGAQMKYGFKITDDSCKKVGHAYGSWTTTKKATCSEDGSKTRTCSSCGATEKKTIEATGHSYSSWKTTKKATCSTKGEQTRTCSVCSKVETKAIATLEHTGTWKTTKKATCSTKGEQSRTCTVCSKVETKAIDKLAHSYGGWKTVKAATCSAQGTQERVCSVCSKKETSNIAMLAHSYGSWKVTKEATCTAEGTQTRSCSKCSKTETEKLAMLDHNYTAVTVVREATCGKLGLAVQTCLGCNKTIESSIPKEEHEFGEDVITQEARPEMQGFGERTCKNCGYVEAFRVAYSESESEDGAATTVLLIALIAVVGGIAAWVIYKKKKGF